MFFLVTLPFFTISPIANVQSEMVHTIMQLWDPNQFPKTKDNYKLNGMFVTKTRKQKTKNMNNNLFSLFY